MSDLNYFHTYFAKINTKLNQVSTENLEACCKNLLSLKKSKKKLIIVGNGGSASIASHVSVDFNKMTGIETLNFNEPNIITCLANDYGYENWVSKALDYYGKKNDIIILISSSGESPNIVNAAKKAKELNIRTITFTGFSDKNSLKNLNNSEYDFWVDSNSYNIIEMTHHIWLVSMVDLIASQN